MAHFVTVVVMGQISGGGEARQKESICVSLEGKNKERQREEIGTRANVSWNIGWREGGGEREVIFGWLVLL